MPAKRKITRKVLHMVRDYITEAYRLRRPAAEEYVLPGRPVREIRGSRTPDPTLSALEAAEAAAEEYGIWVFLGLFLRIVDTMYYMD